MTEFEDIIKVIFDKTKTDTVFTYPGTPGQHIYEYVLENDNLEINQVVREQHLLHLAQTRYYRKLEQGKEEIPVVVVSGGMGEGMASQPLVAGSLSAPILMIVTEPGLEHKGNSNNTVYQTDRGKTPEKIENNEALRNHDNVEERMLFDKSKDLNDLETMLDSIKDSKGVGVLHLPQYKYKDANEGYSEVVEKQTESLDKEVIHDRLKDSDNPVIFVGRGVKHPKKVRKVKEIANNSGAVITSSWQMDGYFEDNYAGSLGVCGTPSANEAFFQSDLVLAIGTSVNLLQSSLNPEILEEFKKKVIQIDDSDYLDSSLVKARSNDSIEEVLNTLESVEGDKWFRYESYGLEMFEDVVPDNIKAVGEVIRENFSDRAVTLGVGNAMVWLPAVMGPEVKKESSRTGSMGEVIAGLNREDKPIIVVGDGEFEMDLSIIPEALQQDSAATIIVTWNKRLGLVTERQEEKTGEILTPKENYVNYERLGEGFEGVKSHVPETPGEIRTLLKNCLNNERVDIVAIPIEEKISTEIFDLTRLPRLSD